MEKEKQYKHPIYIISDEPYRDLAYDGIPVPFIPNYYKNKIIVYSWSKSLSLPSEIIGYIAINPYAQDSEPISRAAIISNRVIGFVNAPSLFQYVINHTLSVISKIDFYDYNRKILYENLKRIGYECVYPQVTFYSPVMKINLLKKQKYFDYYLFQDRHLITLVTLELLIAFRRTV